MGRVLKFPRIPGIQEPEPAESNQSEDLRDLDLTSLAYQENPAPWLHRIREEEPVFHTRHGYWLLTRYSDVKVALRDPRFSSDWSRLRGVPQGNSRTNANKRLVQSSFNMKDPPEHTRMRSLINLAFAGIAVESRRNRIAELSNQLWQARGPQAEFCLVEDFGFHLPIIVAAEMIGIPIEDRLLFRRLFEDAELLFLSGRTPEQEERGRRALAEQIRYIRALVADRRNHWQDDQRRSHPRDNLFVRLVFVKLTYKIRWYVFQMLVVITLLKGELLIRSIFPIGQRRPFVFVLNHGQ